MGHPEIQPAFYGRRVIVTGGTGTFGHAIVRALLDIGYDAARVLVVSRDEKKQWEMRAEIDDTRLGFALCDVRDRDRVMEVWRGFLPHGVFHAAALKHVVGCERHPLEAVKTNVLGAENVLAASARYGVERLVAISTDKAVAPVNVMGITKALQERLVLAANVPGKLETTVIRYGNVLGSRGSVVPFFVRLLKQGVHHLPITDERMTRFLLTVSDAVGLALDAYLGSHAGMILVRKAPAARIVDVAFALAELLGVKIGLKFTEPAHGEKLVETLVSRDEWPRSEDIGKIIRICPHAAWQREGFARAYESDSSLLDMSKVKELLLSAVPDLLGV